jgi:hypothetical protein
MAPQNYAIRSRFKPEEEEAMQIILQEDVEKLGTRGEVVEVAAGYARNFLLPHKLAQIGRASCRERV